MEQDALLEIATRATNLRDTLLRDSFGARADRALNALRTIETELDEAFRGRVYFRVPHEIRRPWVLATKKMDAEQLNAWAASLLCDLIAHAPQRLSRARTPASVLPYTAAAFSRILDDVEREPDAPRSLENDVFLKDLGICSLEMFPCVAQVVNKNAGVPRKVAARNFFRATSHLLSLGLRTNFRFKRFFAIHTHTPMLEGFTPEGWDLCYLLIADLLKQYPDHQGMMGASWFYDPMLGDISPRLSYLREAPLSGGALLLRVGQSPGDVANATATSELRRKLYQSGKYHPTSWLLVWHRDHLLPWAEANRDRITRTPLVLRSR